MKFWLPAVFAGICFLILLGPVPGPQNTQPMIQIPSSLNELEILLEQREQRVSLKPDNRARIIWADSARKEKTAVSVVYIHGFSASFGEGEPFHREFASKLGANLFVPRLAHHGLTDPDAFKNAKAEDFFESAAEALEIGRALGNRVIVLATSMGGALALHEVSRNDDRIAALLLFSPLIDFKDPTTVLLDKPWGARIASWVVGGDYYQPSKNPSEEETRYWYQAYHVNGLVTVKNTQALTSKEDVWKNVKIPVFVGYFYKSEAEQDQTVSVDAILEMTGKLGVPKENLEVVNFPEAGDHVITSAYTTSAWPEVLQKSLLFVEKHVSIN